MYTSSTTASCSGGAFDSNLLAKQLLTRQITAEQYVERLSQESDDETQEKLYNVLKNGFFSVEKDETRASSLLGRASKATRNWALWIKAKEKRGQQRSNKPTKYDFILADRGHAEAKTIVYNSGIFKDALSFIDSLKKKSPTQIRREICGFERKWKDIGMGFPLFDLSVLLNEMKMKEEAEKVLEQALDLGCVSTIDNVVLVASKYRMSGNRQLQPKAYALYEKVLRLITYSAHPKYSIHSMLFDTICSELGMMNLYGYGNISPDRAKSLSFFQLAKNPLPLVYNKLACIYQDGFEGMPPNEEIAKEYHRKAVEGGNIPSMMGLARLLKKNASLRAEARAWYIKAAEGGHPGAMHVMARWCWEEGDEDQTLVWDRKAAESGHPSSMVNTAYGCFRKQQCNEAIAWLQRALLVKSSDTNTLSDGSTVSIHHYCSQGWENRVRASSWNLLGYLHEIGFEGFEKNEQEALSYFRQSASLNDDFAQYSVGRLLIKHPETYKEAIEHFTLAAHGGHTFAMMRLVNIYFSSKANQDREKGIFWLERANALGNEEAKKYLENLEIEDSKMEEMIESSEKPVEPVVDLDSDEDNDEEMDEIIVPSSSTSSSSSSSNSYVDESASLEETQPIVTFDWEEEIFPKQTPRNPKYIRKNLRRLNAERQTEIEQKPLSSRSQGIAQKIVAEEYVSHNELRRFFEDPAFERHDVRLSLTRNGLKIDATNKMTGERDSTSTHKVHGTNRSEAFRARLRKLMENVFPWAAVS